MQPASEARFDTVMEASTSPRRASPSAVVRSRREHTVVEVLVDGHAAPAWHDGPVVPRRPRLARDTCLG